MLGIDNHPPKNENLFYIKIGKYYIYSDNELDLACVWYAYEKIGDNFKIWAIRFKLGNATNIIFVNFSQLVIMKLSYEDFEAIKINYPSIIEVECDIDKVNVEKVPIQKGKKWDLKKIGLFGALILALGIGYKMLFSPEEEPKSIAKPYQVPVIHKPKKKKTVQKQKQLQCVGNVDSFINNFVLGSKVETDNETGKVEILFQASNGAVYKAELKPKIYNKLSNLTINLIPGISFIDKPEQGMEFLGKDYDLCLNFIQENSDKPLYINRLDEKGCVIWLFSDCLKLAKLRRK